MSYKVLFLLVTVLSGCAAPGSHTTPDMQTPIDPQINAKCQVEAGLTADTTTSAITGGLGGSALCAATGAIVGAIVGSPGTAAAAGAAGCAIPGAIIGGMMGNSKQEEAYRRCVEREQARRFMQGIRPSQTPQQFRQTPLSSKEQRRQQLLQELDDLDRTP